MQLSGAHVLITGASRGIGAHLATLAVERGALVTLVARSAEPLQARAEQIGGHALAVDLALRTARVDLIARAEQQAGRPVDILINCAGVDAVAGLLEVDAEQLAALFEVNLLAPAELIRQCLPGMIARGRGHVVDISSGFAAVVAPGLVPYAASKAGMSHFHAGLRTEVKGTGVGTTLVELGPVSTDMWNGIAEQGLASAALNRFAALRLSVLSEPDKVATRILDAVEAGRRHVVVPRRLRPVMMFGWIPRRMADLALTGVARR